MQTLTPRFMHMSINRYEKKQFNLTNIHDVINRKTFLLIKE